VGTHLVGNKSATAFVVNAPVEGRAVGLVVHQDRAQNVPVERAVLALRRARCKHGLRNGTARRTFGLAGLGHFRHEVLFQRGPLDTFAPFARELRKSFQ
jgi:hypothetical protein